MIGAKTFAWCAFGWSALVTSILLLAYSSEEISVPHGGLAIGFGSSAICLAGSYKSLLVTLAAAAGLIAFVVIEREEFGIWFGGAAGLAFLAAIARVLSYRKTHRVRGRA